MKPRRAAGVLIASLLAAACGVEPQDAPEPLDMASSPPALVSTASERPSLSLSPPPTAPTADPTASG
jgi:hypothetical protein